MVKYDYNNYFIKLSNNLIWDCSGKDSITLATNGKTILALSNLAFRCNVLGNCYFTLENLITECGYIPRTGKKNINEQFKNILIKLEELGYIFNSNVKMTDIKPSTFINCQINTTFKKNDKGEDVEFFSLFYKDYIRMLNVDKAINKDILLNVYCYISSRINHRSKDNRSTRRDGSREEGSAEYTYFTYEDVAKHLNISETTFKECVDILVEEKLIGCDNIGLIKKGDKTRVANNVYVIDLEELKPALDGSIIYYKGEGYEILGKKTDGVTKQIIGLNSRINQLSEQGYDTSKLDKKLEKLEKQKEKKPKKVDMEKLREETRKIAVSNLDITKPYIENWNRKYNTTALLCNNVNEMMELRKTMLDVIGGEGRSVEF